MNTLTKLQTQNFFNAVDGYDQLVQNWSKYTNDSALRKTLTVYDHLAYAIFRGKDWRKGFTPVTNAVKLANGQAPYYAVMGAKYHFGGIVNHSVFKDIIKDDAGKLAMQLFSLKGIVEGDAYAEGVLV